MKITDIFDELDIRESDVESLDFKGKPMDEQEKERILKKAFEKIPPQGRKSFMTSRRKKIGLLVLAAVFLMGFTVSAAEYFRLNGNLRSFLGIPRDYQKEELVSMTVDLKQTEERSWKTKTEYNGVTISASQTVSDGETMYVYFDIELPDEMFAESDDNVSRITRFRENTYSIGTLKDIPLGEMVIQRNENDSGHFYAIADMELDTFHPGDQELSMTFSNLGYIEADSSGTNWIELLSGEWSLNWKLEYRDSSKSYLVKKELPIKEGTVEIQNVQLSPFSIKLTGVIKSKEPSIDSLIAIDGIILADDSCVNEMLKIAWTDAGDGNLVMKGIFKDMADIENIKGVRINGVDIIFKHVSDDF